MSEVCFPFCPSFAAGDSSSFLGLGSSGGPVANLLARCCAYMDLGMAARLRKVKGDIEVALIEGLVSRARFPDRRRSVAITGMEKV